MWKEIIKAFKQEDVVAGMSTQIGEMLDAGKWMFEQASDVLMRRAESSDLSDPLYEKDQQINRIEQSIRERIVTHLSVAQDQADLAPCLVLMSVVKDAERIGDYCKNIFEVGKYYRGPYEHREYGQPLEEIREAIADLFEPAKQCFLESDRSVAKKLLRTTAGMGKQCDVIITQLLSVGDGLPANEAVAYVLLARHYKRVEAHLSNIATSVRSPIPLLDYRHKPGRST